MQYLQSKDKENMMKAFHSGVVRLSVISRSQLRQGRTCQGQFWNLYHNTLQQTSLLDHPSKLPRVCGLPSHLALPGRCFSFKSAMNSIRWTTYRFLEHLDVLTIKTPIADVQGRLPKSGSIRLFKPIFPQLPNHSVIKRPQEMKKLQEAYQSMKVMLLDYQPTVVYLKGEPGVGKTQLARMFAEDYYGGMEKTDVVVATIDMTDFSNDYRKVAVKLGINPDLADGLPLKEVAKEMKNILERKKNKWLLVIDNYNSTQQLGLEGGMHNSYDSCSE